MFHIELLGVLLVGFFIGIEEAKLFSTKNVLSDKIFDVHLYKKKIQKHSHFMIPNLGRAKINCIQIRGIIFLRRMSNSASV